MPRTARAKSLSGYYHVVLKGAGNQVIFEDDVDRRVFLDLLGASQEKVNYVLIAWCLMSNHAHLVVCDVSDTLDKAMHLVASRYAQWFNAREGHVGPVFNSRYWSAPIESNTQLLATVRYVHRNPQEAGLCAAPDYEWSSFCEYARTQWPSRGMCDTSVLLDLLGGARGFVELVCAPTSPYVYGGTSRRPSDEEAMALAREATGMSELWRIKSLLPPERDRMLMLLQECNISMRQAERITGVGRATVAKAYHGNAPKGTVPNGAPRGAPLGTVPFGA